MTLLKDIATGIAFAGFLLCMSVLLTMAAAVVGPIQ